MIMSVDIYTEARIIQDMLVSEGHGDRARRLKSAIDQGSTGSEILMALRFEIDQIIPLPNLSELVRLKLDMLRKEISSALGGP